MGAFPFEDVLILNRGALNFLSPLMRASSLPWKGTGCDASEL